jgi:dolichol-phosphate mannosyltransferase
LVFPILNEEENLPALFHGIRSEFAGTAYEIVLVDDGSADRSWPIIADEAQRDPRVRGVRLTRNFGHQVALIAGLREARGAAVITLDADMQDPLPVAKQMIEKWKEGFDVVDGRRVEREGESVAKRLTAFFHYRFLSAAAVQPVSLDVGDFRLLSRRAVAALASLPDRVRYLRGEVTWLGLRRTEVAYRRARRRGGSSSFTLARMLRFAAGGVVSVSDFPLRAALLSALLCFGLGAGLLLTAAVSRLLGGGLSIEVFIGGALLLVAGTVAASASAILLYLTVIYQEVRRRPLYMVSDVTFRPISRFVSVDEEALPVDQGLSSTVTT